MSKSSRLTLSPSLNSSRLTFPRPKRETPLQSLPSASTRSGAIKHGGLGAQGLCRDHQRCLKGWGRHQKYTWPGPSWQPSACEADVIATRPQVFCYSGSKLKSWSQTAWGAGKSHGTLPRRRLDDLGASFSPIPRHLNFDKKMCLNHPASPFPRL